MAAKRWPDGIVLCPTCGSADVRFMASRHIWECKTKHPKRQFSIKVGTVMEDSPIGLDKWLCAFWMLANCKNGISSYEIHRALGITQKSAWFMLHRIRLAMKNGSLLKVGGSGAPVELDETFIGGKAKNMHSDKRKLRITRRGAHDKAIVFGILERGGAVHATTIPNRTARTVAPILKAHVEDGCEVMTDEMTGYNSLRETYVHQVVNHAVEYVSGQVHTNGIENFWSLLKRGLNGTYVAVEPFHLDRYLDEQVFRFNSRKTKKQNMTDADRFNLALSQIAGKRLTYAEVTGKVCETSF
jgi:transposase-like protein